MKSQNSYLLNWAFGLLATLVLSGIADAATSGNGRQKYFLFGAIYEKDGKDGSRARVVVDKVEYLEGNPGKLKQEFTKQIQALETRNLTWVHHLVPTSTTAIVYSFTMYNGRTKGIAVAEGENQAAAERAMQNMVKIHSRKNVQIIKGWPTAADLEGVSTSSTAQQGVTPETAAPTDTKPKKRGLFGFLRPNPARKAKVSATPARVNTPENTMAPGQGNNIPPQVANNEAVQTPQPPTPGNQRVAGGNAAQMMGKYAFVSGTSTMPFGSTPMQPVVCEVTGTASKPVLTLSAQLYDLQQTGPGTYSFADSDEHQSSRGTVSFQDGVLRVEHNITMFEAGITIVNASTHRK